MKNHPHHTTERRRFSLRGASALLGTFWLLALWSGPSFAHDAAPAASTKPSPYPAMAPFAAYTLMSQAEEIAHARTAAPKEVSDKATVMVLGKQGYETAVKGSNGFVCLVMRSWGNDFGHPQFWNPKIHQPQCWNAAAASSVLADYLKRTEWVLAGVSQDEMSARTNAEIANHEIGSPAAGGMVFMMSKDQYILDSAPGPATPGSGPSWFPHVMFYLPATDASVWGANAKASPIVSTTSKSEPITTFFVLVPDWSDGTPSPYFELTQAQK